ncbi:MAG: hypothetical protein ABIL09_11325 [Gemmatimonadota bacterium]
MTEIARLTFLIHPFCYAASLGNPTSMPIERWQAYHARELTVAARWRRELEGAAEDEAVVFHPCYPSAEADGLVAMGRQCLGDRFLVLPGRGDLYTSAAMAALAPEVGAAFAARGKYAWSVHDLRIAAFSWHYARDLRAGFAARGLALDPGRLRFRAMGESFEGCATTWTTMVPHYLGSRARVEIDFDCTVPDTGMLLACRHLGRVALDGDTALYLFTDPAGRHLAHFKRERVALDEPSLRARLAAEPDGICVLDSLGRVLLSPGCDLPAAVPADLARRGDGYLDVMVSTGRGRGAGGPGFWPREAPLFLRAEPGAGLHVAAQSAGIAPIDS